MGEFLQTLFVGLRLGSVYALIALGYTMVYGIVRLINFAHGDFIMVGGYTLIFTVPLMTAAGLPAWTAVVIAVAVCALVGVLVELIAYRPVRRKGTNMTALITAVAMSLFLENLAQAIPAIGPNPIIAGQLFASGGFRVAGVTLDYITIYTIAVSAVVMLLLYVFTQKTRLGRAMRCVSEDKGAAVLMGISVNKTVLATFAIGSGLSAAAALMYVAQYPKVYTVVGGIGLIPGAMLGGIVIGLVESFSTAYISSSMTDTFVFFILIVVLLLKPAGILGKNVGEKV